MYLDEAKRNASEKPRNRNIMKVGKCVIPQTVKTRWGSVAENRHTMICAIIVVDAQIRSASSIKRVKHHRLGFPPRRGVVGTDKEGTKDVV